MLLNNERCQNQNLNCTISQLKNDLNIEYSQKQILNSSINQLQNDLNLRINQLNNCITENNNNISQMSLHCLCLVL